MEALIGAILGFIIGIPVVKAFLDKTVVKAEVALDLLLTVVKAIDDGTVTPKEVRDIVEKIENLNAVIPVLKGLIKKQTEKK